MTPALIKQATLKQQTKGRCYPNRQGGYANIDQ